MKQNIIITIAIFICSGAVAQDYWSIAPAFPTNCYSQEGDYNEKLGAAIKKNKTEMDAKSDALKKKNSNMSKEDQMKMATQQMNMTPAQIKQMQEDQMNMMTMMQTMQERQTEVTNRYNELETQYRNEFATKLGPIESEMRKLPDGEGTPQWAIDKGGQLKAQYDKEYNALCAKYFTGADSPFKLWLADYKKYLLETEIPYTNKTQDMQSKQYGLAADNSVAVMDAVGKYLGYCKTIFGLRKPYP